MHRAIVEHSMVPFAAVAGAGSLNLVAVRWKEMSEGVEVTDKDGIVRGKSIIAGQYLRH
jgi:hypothetical protein